MEDGNIDENKTEKSMKNEKKEMKEIKDEIRRMPVPTSMWFLLWLPLFHLKLEVEISPETLVKSCQTARRHIAEDSNLISHSCDNLKSNVAMYTDCSDPALDTHPVPLQSTCDLGTVHASTAGEVEGLFPLSLLALSETLSHPTYSYTSSVTITILFPVWVQHICLPYPQAKCL
jgi:hypothetical protein